MSRWVFAFIVAPLLGTGCSCGDAPDLTEDAAADGDGDGDTDSADVDADSPSGDPDESRDSESDALDADADEDEDALHPSTPELAAIPENTALDLGVLHDTEVGGDYGVVDDIGGMTYYAAGRSILLFGGGHGTTQTDVVYEFSFEELTWRAMYPRTPDSEMIDDEEHLDSDLWAWINRSDPPLLRPLSRHTRDLQAVAERQGVLLLMMRTGYSDYIDGPSGHYFSTNPRPSSFPAFDIASRTWSWILDTEVTGASAPANGYTEGAIEYDPVSGLVVIVGQTDYECSYDAGIWVYDPETEQSQKVLDYPRNTELYGTTDMLVYFPLDGNMYFFAQGDPGRVFEVALDRESWGDSTITELTDMVDTPSWGYQTRGFAVDTEHDVIGGVIQGGVIHIFDPTTRVWTEREMVVDSPTDAPIGDLSHFAIVYDPVDGVFVFLSDGATPTWETRRTWAYRYAP